MGSWLTVLLDTLANKYIILVTFNSSSERPSSLAMIKSSISSYQDQLATFVGIVCQDKKARPQKHSEGYEPKTTFFLTSIRNGTNSQIFITAST